MHEWHTYALPLEHKSLGPMQDPIVSNKAAISLIFITVYQKLFMMAESLERPTNLTSTSPMRQLYPSQ